MGRHLLSLLPPCSGHSVLGSLQLREYHSKQAICMSSSCEASPPWEQVVKYWGAGPVADSSVFSSGVILQPDKQAKPESRNQLKGFVWNFSLGYKHRQR